MKKCTHCGEPIVLVPSATARAKNSEKTASYYINLFTIHADCVLEIRRMETKLLLERINNKKEK